MMNHYIFSYGSLAHKKVAAMTGETLGFIPARLRGHARNFRVRVPSRGFAAAGIEKDKDSEVLGMLVEVPEAELPKFDERERLYDRVELKPEDLSLLSGDPLPDGKYHLYVPKDPQPPTEEMPLAQSYIDVCIIPFIEMGGDIALQVARGMRDLDRPWIDDRKMPRYSRYLEDADGEAVDVLFKKVAAEALEARQLAEPARIKPELARACLQTIRFFDLFDFPLTAEEIKENLYKFNAPLHIKELKMTLDHLVSEGRLSEIKGYYVLPGRENLIETRKTRKFIAEKFWNRTKLYGTYMRSVPFTRMIAVCNNLAYDNPSEQSDIDLFIVVRPGRMWLARLLITMILHFYGVRRYADKVAGRFCLSFFVTTGKMDMREFELAKEDPYLAYWTKHLRPIVGHETYQEFQALNKDWLAQYGLRFDDSYKKHMYHYEDGRLKKFSEWLLGGFLGDQFEKLLKATLKRKTLKSMQNLGPDASVIVTDEILKFHNHDRRQEFFERWKESDEN